MEGEYLPSSRQLRRLRGSSGIWKTGMEPIPRKLKTKRRQRMEIIRIRPKFKRMGIMSRRQQMERPRMRRMGRKTPRRHLATNSTNTETSPILRRTGRVNPRMDCPFRALMMKSLPTRLRKMASEKKPDVQRNGDAKESTSPKDEENSEKTLPIRNAEGKDKPEIEASSSAAPDAKVDNTEKPAEENADHANDEPECARDEGPPTPKTEEDKDREKKESGEDGK